MRHSMTLLAAALALASGAALAQGASGIGAAASAGTMGNSIDVRAGSTGTAQAQLRDSGSTTVMGASSATVYTAPTSTTIVTSSWVNVPAGAESRADFRRWQNLR